MYLKLFVLILLLFNYSTAFASNFDWWLKLQKIKPLHSNRSEVEAVFKKPENSVREYSYYRIPEGELSVEYADGKCATDGSGDWDAPKETVISFDFTPNAETRLFEFVHFTKINLNKFSVKKGVVDTPQITYNYNNENDGVYLYVFERRNKRYLYSVTVDAPSNFNYPVCK
jgi:hypothetical protein